MSSADKGGQANAEDAGDLSVLEKAGDERNGVLGGP